MQRQGKANQALQGKEIDTIPENFASEKRSASWARAGSFEASASRAFFTADFTCVRTAWFLARRFSACRFRF